MFLWAYFRGIIKKKCLYEEYEAHYSAVLQINPSQMSLYHLDLKSSTLPLEKGGGTLFSGKENPLHWCRGRFACRSLGKTSTRERERLFPFQRASCNFSALMANWQLYREGKKTRRSNRLFNGCRNCRHKHSGELALPKGQERLCNVSHEKVDEAAYLLVPLKDSKNESKWEKQESTKRQSRLEPY